jgi:hypothetical protein
VGSVGPHVPEMTKCMVHSLSGISVIFLSKNLATAAGHGAGGLLGSARKV